MVLVSISPLKRTKSTPKINHSWVCSFDRNGPCRFGPKIPTKKFDQTDNLKKSWKSSFVTNTNDKTQGQYFFSEETIDVILSNLSKKKRILLVGCPSLLVPLYEKGFKVKLLDIDQRFLRIFPPDMFHLFNMMNCHFFTKKHNFDSFIQSKNLVIIADPPFGVQVSLGCSYEQFLSANVSLKLSFFEPPISAF